MKTKDEIIAILQNFKEEFGKRYGIEKLGLFGSVARGEQKEDSDIDICVKLQEPDYFTRMEIKESLEERFNAKVDVVSLTAIMRSLFRNHIEKDAIYRCGSVISVNDFLASPDKMDIFDATCMRLQTIGETVKNIDNLTFIMQNGSL